jgi:hypothetical protein
MGSGASLVFPQPASMVVPQLTSMAVPQEDGHRPRCRVCVGRRLRRLRCSRGPQQQPPQTAATPSATPTETPDQKFQDDMDNAFGAEINQGKNLWNHRFFTEKIAGTGHEICEYLGSHSYDETAQRFKLSLPMGYPSDSDAKKFVNLAIDDLCPQYARMTSTPAAAPPASSAPGPPVHAFLIDVTFLRAQPQVLTVPLTALSHGMSH